MGLGAREILVCLVIWTMSTCKVKLPEVGQYHVHKQIISRGSVFQIFSFATLGIHKMFRKTAISYLIPRTLVYQMLGKVSWNILHTY